MRNRMSRAGNHPGASLNPGLTAAADSISPHKLRYSIMRIYLQSLWVKVGLGLLVVGSAPLLFIIIAAAVGLWPDPDPNPIGPGLLFFFTSWPAIICIVVGVTRVRARNGGAP